MTGATTIASVQASTRDALRAAGIPNPGLEARLIVAHALGLGADPLAGGPRRDLAQVEVGRIEGLCRRRAAGEPLAYILGQREFFSLPFLVTPATLIPRPDSETLVEAALGSVADSRAPVRILDLGTGSGCLVLSLLYNLPCAWGLGIDRDAGALAVARANAEALGLGARAAFACCEWTRGLGGRFDLVVANPPYILSGDLPGLAAEARDFEPRLALDGGADGLAEFRRVIPDLCRLLAPDGRAFVEIGWGQADAVAALLPTCGLELLATERDLAGIPRCVVAAPAFSAGTRKSLESNQFPTSVGSVAG